MHHTIGLTSVSRNADLDIVGERVSFFFVANFMIITYDVVLLHDGTRGHERFIFENDVLTHCCAAAVVWWSVF